MELENSAPAHTIMERERGYFDLNVAILKLAGLWIPDQGERWPARCLYLAYNLTFIGYSVVVFTPMELLAFGWTYRRTEQLMKNVSVGGTHFLAALKILLWYRHRKQIIGMMRTMEARAADYGPLGDFRPADIVREERAVKNFTTVVFLLLGASVSVTAYIAATWTLLTDYRKYEEVAFDDADNRTVYRYTQKLPYHVVMPFGYDTSKGRFAIALAYNCFPSFHFAWIIIGVDTTFTALVSYISAHLRILQGAFKTIRARCLRAMEKPDSTALHDSAPLGAAMMDEMNRCVDHLQLIFKMCHEVEDIFTYLTLAQVLSSQILICACLYMVSAIPITSKAFTTELIYLVAVEMQVALYCFFGNKVTLTGEDISLALYEGDWLSASVPFRKSMLITMTQMRKPIYLTMGKFSPLTLSTFVSIGRASYSFFAVIKNHKPS